MGKNSDGQSSATTGIETHTDDPASPPYGVDDLLTIRRPDGLIYVRLEYVGKYEFLLGRVIGIKGNCGNIKVQDTIVVDPEHIESVIPPDHA